MNHFIQKFFPKLAQQADFQKIIQNFFWLFLDKGIKIFTGLFVGAWQARYLGDAQFGVLNSAISLVTMVATLTTLGLDSLVMKKMLENLQKNAILLGSSFLMRTVSGIFIFLLLNWILRISTPQDTISHQLVLVISLYYFFQSLDIIDWIFQTRLEVRYTIVVKTVALLLASFLKIYLIVFEYPLEAFAWGIALEYIFASLGLVLIYKKRGFAFDWQFDKKVAVDLFKSSWSLLFSAVFVILNMEIDKVMLKYGSSNSEAGIYSAAARLSQLWYFVPIFLGSSLMPRLVDSYKIGKDRYEKLQHKIFALMTAISVFLGILTVILSENVVLFIFGQGYFRSALVLSLHIWTAVFVFHISIRTRTLVVEGLQKYVGIFSFFVLCSNILFNWWLIPPYGSVGASWASLLSWAFSVLIVPLFFEKTRQMPLFFIQSFAFWKYLSKKN